jgi:hypothetical protein
VNSKYLCVWSHSTTVMTMQCCVQLVEALLMAISAVRAAATALTVVVLLTVPAVVPLVVGATLVIPLV